MTKDQILNGMSEEDFYSLYPTQVAWEMALGGTPFGAGIMLQQGGPSPVSAMDPDAWEREYGRPSISNYNDPLINPKFPSFNTRGSYNKFKTGNPNFAQYSDADMQGLGVDVPPIFVPNPKQKSFAYNPAGQSPEGVGLFNNSQGQQFTFSNGSYNPYIPNASNPVVNKQNGGGLDRSKDYDSKKKPYPSVSGSDFAGSGRSYPIPTRADAIDALRLASLHGRSDVKSKVYAKYPDLKKEKGGDITMQGANQDFLKQRSSEYTSFLQNNVMKNLQQEEATKVQNAFNQMEYGMHEMPDGTMMPNGMMQFGGYPIANANMQDYRTDPFQNKFNPATLNPQNHALQNMLVANMDMFKNQASQDQNEFRQANMDLFHMPYAQAGAQLPMHSDLLHQMAAEFGPSSRRNGLPLFPGNMSPYYGINSKDAKALSEIPKEFKANGLEITPKYGILGRTNFGKKLGIGPKSIHYKFTDKNGSSPYMQGPQVDLSNYNPAPQGTVQTPTQSFMPQSNQQGLPGEHNWNFQSPIEPAFPMNNKVGPLASQELNESDPMKGYIPKEIYMQSQLQKNAKGGLLKKYQKMGEVYNNPIAMSNNWSFTGTPPIDYKKNAFGSNDGVNNITMQGNEEDVSIEGDFNRKWNGVGETIGQWAVPVVNKVAGLFEAKDYRKNKKKLDQSMLADNAFINTPMNAKNRGDYDLNSGMFRPDQKVPIQFPGYAQWGGFNTMQMGGGFGEGEELELSPEEIADLKAQGYELENLD